MLVINRRRKEPVFCDTTNGFAMKWCLRNKTVQKFHTDDAALPRSTAVGYRCFWLVETVFQTIKSTIEIWASDTSSVFCIEFLCSFVRYDIVGKPVVASRNIGFFHYNLGQKVLRILLFLMHSRPTLQIWHHGDPSPTPPWSMLLSREQKCSGHTFFWGGVGGNILSELGFRGKDEKMRHTTVFSLSGGNR